jgi:transposase
MRCRIGEEVREQLEYVPASLIVIEHIRPKYALCAARDYVEQFALLPCPTG